MTTRGFLLWILLACTPLHAVARGPELPPPPDARVWWVAENMTYNTMPMAVRQFTTKHDLQRVIDFYRDEWQQPMPDGAPGYVINDLVPPWLSISRIEDGYMLLVQARATDDEGTTGLLSISKLPTSAKAPELGKGFPTMGETKAVNEFVSNDEGQTGRTMMFVNKHDLPTNLSFYRSRYQDNGWVVDMDKGVGDVLHVLALRKGRQRLDIVLTEMKQGVTRIVANEVTYDLL